MKLMPVNSAMVRNLLRELVRSKSIHMASWIGVGGVALTVANLAYAHLLEPEEFGFLSLLQAILSLAVPVAPLGFDTLILRGELGSTGLSIRAAGTATLIGAPILCCVFATLYDLSVPALFALIIACALGGLSRVFLVIYQADFKLNTAQAIGQSPTLVFLLGAVLLLILENKTLESAMSWLILSYILSGAVGFVIYRTLPVGPRDTKLSCMLSASERWRRALSFVAIAASVYVLLQAERLVIPKTLSLADLATFAVAWSVAGSPYKLLTSGIGFALVPRLRVTKSAKARRTLVFTELRLAATVGVISAALLIPFSDLAIEYLYGGKYEVTLSLITAIVLSGLIRLTYGVASSMITALAEGRELQLLNLSGWLTTAGAIFLASVLSRYGLYGVVIGVTAGWLSRTIIVFLLLKRSLMSDQA